VIFLLKVNRSKRVAYYYSSLDCPVRRVKFFLYIEIRACGIGVMSMGSVIQLSLLCLDF
jgi:hypothetical protein